MYQDLRRSITKLCGITVLIILLHWKAFWVTEFCNQCIDGIYMCEGPPVAGQAWEPSNVALFEAHHTFSKPPMN